MLMIFLLASAVLGILFMLLCWWIYKCIFNVDDAADMSKDVEIMEQWDIKTTTDQK